MNCIRLYISLFLVACFFIGSAQEKIEISAPTNLPETGVNRVLCMKNGNTVLFHLEPNKDIHVIVFDSLHKEIGNCKDPTAVMNNDAFEGIMFKGLYEINGEAVLFFDQERLGKHCLIRTCFNGQNGKLAEEKIVAESKSKNKPMNFFVMKNRDDDDYSILFCTDIPQFQECDIVVTSYNKKHEQIREVKLDVDRKKYDYLEVMNAETQPNGINVSLVCGSLKEGGSSSGGAPAVYDHHLILFYIPKGASIARSASVHLPDDVAPYYSNYTYNSFAKALNLLLFSYKEIVYKAGIAWLPAVEMQHIFFKVDEGTMDVNYKWIRHSLASKELKGKIDSSAFFEGIPKNMFTNDNGLSTIISESFSKDMELETRVRRNYYTDLGTIGITQVDDDGNELWATVLPMRQRYKSHKGSLSPHQLSKKWQSQGIFGDFPEAAYERQFVSFSSYNHNKNVYIIYNDDDKNFNNSITQSGDTVYNFSATNACYYKMDRKKEITKHYLYGAPDANEYKTSFIEGADFDEKRGVYVSLIQYKKEKDISLCMAWSHLE